MPQIDLGKIVGDTGPQGLRGLQGNPGEKGETGSPGPGVAVGGAANQVLVKHSGTNFDTMWVDAGSLPVFAGVQYAVAIVADGNTHPAIADGQFVYVRNHSTLAEGLYKATAAIGTNVALTTSNLTADGQGGLNDLKGQVDSLNSKFALHRVVYSSAELTITANGYAKVCEYSALGNGILFNNIVSVSRFSSNMTGATWLEIYSDGIYVYTASAQTNKWIKISVVYTNQTIDSVNKP